MKTLKVISLLAVGALALTGCTNELESDDSTGLPEIGTVVETEYTLNSGKVIPCIVISPGLHSQSIDCDWSGGSGN